MGEPQQQRLRVRPEGQNVVRVVVIYILGGNKLGLLGSQWVEGMRSRLAQWK
jgi:hypothetical protein